MDASFDGPAFYVSAAALLISIGALGVSIFELLENRPKLRIVVGHALTAELHFITVEITNFGRQPTTVQHISFVGSCLKGEAWPAPYPHFGQVGAHFLEPGKTCKYFFEHGRLLETKDGDKVFGELVNTGRIAAKVDHSWSTKPRVVAIGQR